MCKRCQTAWVAVRRGSAHRRRTSGRCLVGLKRGDWREGGETGGARLRSWALIELRHNPIDIDRGGDRDVLQVGLRQAPISALPQAKGPYPLREGPFHARPLLITLLSLLTGIPGPCRVEGVILGAGLELQRARLLLGPCAEGAGCTWPTIVRIEADVNIRTTGRCMTLQPAHRGLALRTVHLLVLPIHGEVFNPVAAFDLGLPALVRTCW